MSLPQETLLQLMALSDGELEGDEKERALRLVAESEEARQMVEAMGSPAIGRWLQEGMHERAAAAAADGIADAVMARVEAADAVAAEGESTGEGGAVVRLATSRPRRGSRASVVVGAVVASLAVAAGVSVYMRSAGTGEDAMKAPVASVVVPTVPSALPSGAPAVVAQRPSQGVEVDEVDSPARGFSVFEIPLGVGAAKAGGPSSVVIMIDDDPGAR